MTRRKKKGAGSKKKTWLVSGYGAQRCKRGGVHENQALKRVRKGDKRNEKGNARKKKTGGVRGKKERMSP